jgi:hypothetical protein
MAYVTFTTVTFTVTLTTPALFPSANDYFQQIGTTALSDVVFMKKLRNIVTERRVSNEFGHRGYRIYLHLICYERYSIEKKSLRIFLNLKKPSLMSLKLAL